MDDSLPLQVGGIPIMDFPTNVQMNIHKILKEESVNIIHSQLISFINH